MCIYIEGSTVAVLILPQIQAHAQPVMNVIIVEH